MIESLKNGLWRYKDKEFDASSLLEAIREDDDKEGGRFLLTKEENEALSVLFASYRNLPDFSEVYFMKASSALFSYLAASQDEELSKAVAASMGWPEKSETRAGLDKINEDYQAYKAWWLEYAEEVLTTEGYDDYRFGRITPSRSGCYLYDDERAVCFVEVSREGNEKRNAVISLTLLGNPEAISTEEENREFEWCCYFDDMFKTDEPRVLGGLLAAIDPYGERSRIMRRYDIKWKDLLPEELGLITKSLISMLALYPPENSL